MSIKDDFWKRRYEKITDIIKDEYGTSVAIYIREKVEEELEEELKAAEKK